MAKNYESENKNSKNSTNRSYENEMNSQDCKNSYSKNSSKNKSRNSYESGEDTTSLSIMERTYDSVIYLSQCFHYFIRTIFTDLS